MTVPDPSSSQLAEARRRYRRLLALMAVASLAVLLAGFAWLSRTGTPLPLPLLGAIAVAVIGSMMLAAALMGLIFFSAASGADRRPDDIPGRPGGPGRPRGPG